MAPTPDVFVNLLSNRSSDFHAIKRKVVDSFQGYRLVSIWIIKKQLQPHLFHFKRSNFCSTETETVSFFTISRFQFPEEQSKRQSFVCGCHLFRTGAPTVGRKRSVSAAALSLVMELSINGRLVPGRGRCPGFSIRSNCGPGGLITKWITFLISPTSGDLNSRKSPRWDLDGRKSPRWDLLAFDDV